MTDHTGEGTHRPPPLAMETPQLPRAFVRLCLSPAVVVHCLVIAWVVYSTAGFDNGGDESRTTLLTILVRGSAVLAAWWLAKVRLRLVDPYPLCACSLFAGFGAAVIIVVWLNVYTLGHDRGSAETNRVSRHAFIWANHGFTALYILVLLNKFACVVRKLVFRKARRQNGDGSANDAERAAANPVLLSFLSTTFVWPMGDGETRILGRRLSRWQEKCLFVATVLTTVVISACLPPASFVVVSHGGCVHRALACFHGPRSVNCDAEATGNLTLECDMRMPFDHPDAGTATSQFVGFLLAHFAQPVVAMLLPIVVFKWLCALLSGVRDPFSSLTVLVTVAIGVYVVALLLPWYRIDSPLPSITFAMLLHVLVLVGLGLYRTVFASLAHSEV